MTERVEAAAAEGQATPVVVRCVNAGCPARLARRLVHYVSPAALDVPGLGPVLLDAVVARGLARSPAALHRLTAADWQRLPGVGAKKAEQFEAAFAAARVKANEDGARLLFALGIPGVGRETARRLAERFHGLAELSVADAEALQGAGLGEAAARGVAGYLADPAVKAEWADLLAAGVGERWSAEKAVNRVGAFAGQSVTLTGTLTRWSRAEAEALLRAAGVEVSATVTRGTTVVVAGVGAGAKLDEARRRGIE
jgi:DNA ligase (NAD+)